MCLHNTLEMEEEGHEKPRGEDCASNVPWLWVVEAEEHVGGDHMPVPEEAYEEEDIVDNVDSMWSKNSIQDDFVGGDGDTYY